MFPPILVQSGKTEQGVCYQAYIGIVSPGQIVLLPQRGIPPQNTLFNQSIIYPQSAMSLQSNSPAQESSFAYSRSFESSSQEIAQSCFIQANGEFDVPVLGLESQVVSDQSMIEKKINDGLQYLYVYADPKQRYVSFKELYEYLNCDEVKNLLTSKVWNNFMVRLLQAIYLFGIYISDKEFNNYMELHRRIFLITLCDEASLDSYVLGYCCLAWYYNLIDEDMAKKFFVQAVQMYRACIASRRYDENRINYLYGKLKRIFLNFLQKKPGLSYKKFVNWLLVGMQKSTKNDFLPWFYNNIGFLYFGANTMRTDW
jgi:hypothetical protein